MIPGKIANLITEDPDIFNEGMAEIVDSTKKLIKKILKKNMKNEPDEVEESDELKLIKKDLVDDINDFSDKYFDQSDGKVEAAYDVAMEEMKTWNETVLIHFAIPYVAMISQFMGHSIQPAVMGVALSLQALLLGTGYAALQHARGKTAERIDNRYRDIE